VQGIVLIGLSAPALDLMEAYVNRSADVQAHPRARPPRLPTSAAALQRGGVLQRCNTLQHVATRCNAAALRRQRGANLLVADGAIGSAAARNRSVLVCLFGSLGRASSA
jgi:hypothetical protein